MKYLPVPFQAKGGLAMPLRRPLLRALSVVSVLVITVLLGTAQSPEPADVKLPNGKSWSSEIAKADYQRNLKDAKELAKLTAEIQNDLETGDPFVLPLKTLKKVEDAEKLAKDLRVRMRRN